MSALVNSTTVFVGASLLFSDSDNISHITFGLPIILVNLLVFAVLFSDRQLLSKSALMTGITSGNLYLGFHMVMFAVYRFLMGQSRQLSPATLGDCVLMIFPLFYPMAFNTEAIFLILASLERLLAISTPYWFRAYWTNRTSWFIAAVGHLTIWIMLFAGMLVSTDKSPYTWACSVGSMYGVKYVRFLSGFSATCGLLSAVLTASALAFGLRRYRSVPLASNEAGRIRKQLQLAKSMATISIFELAFMALPNILSLLINMGYWMPAFVRAKNSTYTNAINCMMVFVASMLFNRRFRRAAIVLLRAQRFAEWMAKMGFKSWGAKNSKSNVHPIGNTINVARPQASERNGGV